MSDIEDSYEDFDDQPSNGGGNRNFMMAIIAVIVVFVIIVVGIAGYFFLTRGGAGAKNTLAGTQAAMIYTQNAQTAAAATQAGATEIAKGLLPSETPIPSPMAAQPNTPTSVVVFPTNTPEPTIINAQTSTTPTTEGVGGPVAAAGDAERTATIAALMTQVASGGTAQAGGTLVGGPLTPTALPQTGFMDELGLPLLLGMAMLFIFIIFMARRLRVSAHQ